jgi:hypothetical protein
MEIRELYPNRRILGFRTNTPRNTLFRMYVSKFLESGLLNAWFLVLRQVDTLSVDVKELCKKTATREYIAGEWVLKCRYLVGMGFRAGGLSLFAESIEDTWGWTEVSY